MYAKKLIIAFCCCIYALQVLAGQPGGNFCGNYTRKLSKKDLRVEPAIDQQRKQGLWELLKAKKAQKSHNPEISRAIRTYYELYSRMLVSSNSLNESRHEAQYSHRISCSRPLTAAVLITMLLFSPEAAAALQQGQPVKDPSLWTCTTDPIQLIKYTPNAPLNGLLYGRLQAVANGLVDFSRWYGELKLEHPVLVEAALPGAMVSLKALFAGILCAVETKSAAAFATCAVAGGGIAIFEEAEAAFAHAVLGDVIDHVVEHGAEHIAPKLMEYDPELSHESAVRVGSFMAATCLASSQFKNFIEHFPTYDITRIGLREGILKVSQAKIEFSEFNPEVANMLKRGTPHVGIHAFLDQAVEPQKSERSLPHIETLAEHTAQLFKTVELPPLSNTVYEPYMRNANKIFHSEDLGKTLTNIGNEQYRQLFDIQWHQDTSRDHFAGSMYQPYIDHASKIMHTDNLKETLWHIDNQPMLRMVDQYFHDRPIEPWAGTVYAQEWPNVFDSNNQKKW